MRLERLTSLFQVLKASTVRQARRVIILAVGLTLLLCGVVMLIIPGPGWLLIFAGLGVLAVEFVWPRQLLKKIKAKGNELGQKISGSSKS